MYTYIVYALYVVHIISKLHIIETTIPFHDYNDKLW